MLISPVCSAPIFSGFSATHQPYYDDGRPAGSRDAEHENSPSVPIWKWFVLLAMLLVTAILIKKYGNRGNPPRGTGNRTPDPPPVRPPFDRQSAMPAIARLLVGPVLERINNTIDFDTVRAQLTSYGLSTSNPKLIYYLTKTAIRIWLNFSDSEQRMFVDVSQATKEGELFAPFIRYFVSRVAPETLDELRRSYLGLPEAVRPSFGHTDDTERPADLFIDFMSSLEDPSSIGEFLRRIDIPWRYDPSVVPVIYKSRDLLLLMNNLVRENAELAYYPRLLEQLAKVLVDRSDNTQAPTGGAQTLAGGLVTAGSQQPTEMRSADSEMRCVDDDTTATTSLETGIIPSAVLFMRAAEVLERPVYDFAIAR